MKLNHKDIARKFYEKAMKLGMNKKSCENAIAICDGKAQIEYVEQKILEIPWEFTKEIYLDEKQFIKEVSEKLQEKNEKWYPQDVIIPEKMIMLCYEIENLQTETLLSNEKILSKGIEGLNIIYQIGARIETENENGFTQGELLRKTQNQLSGKNLGEETILECLEIIENYKEVPIYYIARNEKEE